MKRLALLLGSLLVVSAAASAKEVVPAPVVVEEAPVQVVEKEVIVYRDKEEGFRPNGFVRGEYRYYDRTEGQQRIGYPNWNKNNRYSRLELQTNINFTENQTLDIRSRSYESLANKDRFSGKSKEDQVRVQYYYNHGLLGDTKVNGTSFVEYKNEGSSQSIQYRYDFQFADYMFDNDFIKTTNFVVGPRAIYAWNDSNSSNYSYTLGLYMDWINQLPFGFSTEVEIDGFDYTKFGKTAREESAYNGGNGYVDKYGVSVKAVLMQDTTLYSADKMTVNWHSEGGYDTYNYSNRQLNGHDYGVKGSDAEGNSIFGYRESEYASYEAYFSSDVTLNYQATEFVNLFAGAGAEYRNWTITAEEDASNWRWQPYAFAGFNVAF
ncbi:hypothetical protein [Fusobacterium sp.]|uniref:major outer membrane protein FomA n=1 Tax=Fusobacterium sp. TaxID=68766 RepID=UPI0025C1C832|nr:hypothetical protein [Fusobacterium sp.]